MERSSAGFTQDKALALAVHSFVASYAVMAISSSAVLTPADTMFVCAALDADSGEPGRDAPDDTGFAVGDDDDDSDDGLGVGYAGGMTDEMAALANEEYKPLD